MVWCNMITLGSPRVMSLPCSKIFALDNNVDHHGMCLNMKGHGKLITLTTHSSMLTRRRRSTLTRGLSAADSIYLAASLIGLSPTCSWRSFEKPFTTFKHLFHLVWYLPCFETPITISSLRCLSLLIRTNTRRRTRRSARLCFKPRWQLSSRHVWDFDCDQHDLHLHQQ